MHHIFLIHVLNGYIVLQFSSIKEQGTRIVIYNLWEDEQGELELDFDADVNVSTN